MEDDLSEQADRYLDEKENEWPRSTGILCPRTRQEVLEYETAFDFPGYPEAVFRKIICGRTMSANDYRNILASGDAGCRFDGFFSKAKEKNFSATLKFNPDRLYNNEAAPGVEFVFNGPAKPISEKCPKCGKEVAEFEKHYSFPGNKSRFWKCVAGRNMSSHDYCEILESDNGVLFEGFVSKKTGKPFKTTLKKAPDGVVMVF